MFSHKTGEDVATLPRMSFPRMGNGLSIINVKDAHFAIAVV